MIYSKTLIDNINNEKAGIDYIYSTTDKAILNELIRDINEFASTDFHYLAELDAFDIKGTGQIIARYITRFNSESIKGYLIPQIVSDRIEDCDKLVLQLYLHFKESEEYISPSDAPAPAHIYVRYDNALKTLKPKRLKEELIKLACYPRDAFYLPFTMRMLASWKIPEIKEVLISYLDGSKITSDAVSLEQEKGIFYPSIESIKRELKFTALDGLKYYPTYETIEIVKQHTLNSDQDIKMVAKKTLKILEKKCGSEFDFQNSISIIK